MAPWFRIFEAVLVERLLRSPSFHHAVQKVHKNVHRIRHGIPPEEMGGTKIDRPGGSFLKHFVEEIQEQLGRAPSKRGPNMLDHSKPVQHRSEQRAVPKSGSNTPGYASHFLNKLRDQIRRGGAKH